jgi:hypothetical protein
VSKYRNSGGNLTDAVELSDFAIIVKLCGNSRFRLETLILDNDRASDSGTIFDLAQLIELLKISVNRRSGLKADTRTYISY